MFSSKRKFYLILLVVFLIVVLLFLKEWKKSKNIIIQHKTLPLLSSLVVDIPISKTDQFFGNPGASITIVEFNDLNCPKCLEQHQIIYNIVKKNPRKVRLIWKDAPQAKFLSNIDPTLHFAVFCAGEQKKFWPYLENLIEKNKTISKSNLSETALEQGLNLEKWKKCTTSETAKQKIQESITLAWQLGLKKMPSIFINNQQLNLDENINLNEVLEVLIKK